MMESVSLCANVSELVTIGAGVAPLTWKGNTIFLSTNCCPTFKPERALGFQLYSESTGTS